MTSHRPRASRNDHGVDNPEAPGQDPKRTGAQASAVAGPADLPGMEALVLPGVGTTGATMTRLRDTRLVEPLQTWEGPPPGTRCDSPGLRMARRLRVGLVDHGAGNPAPAGRGPKPEEERPDVTRVRRRRNTPTQRTAPRPAGAVRGRK